MWSAAIGPAPCTDLRRTDNRIRNAFLIPHGLRFRRLKWFCLLAHDPCQGQDSSPLWKSSCRHDQAACCREFHSPGFARAPMHLDDSWRQAAAHLTGYLPFFDCFSLCPCFRRNSTKTAPAARTADMAGTGRHYFAAGKALPMPLLWYPTPFVGEMAQSLPIAA